MIEKEMQYTMPLLEDLKSILRENGVNLSYQRLKVLEYLSANDSHPTVEQIYHNLQEEIPTLSKSTVYNTLKVLVEAGVVRELLIENNEARYDIITDFHGHFKCEQCGKIYNFDVKLDDMAYSGLRNFLIRQKDVYFKGVCPDCPSNKRLS